MTKKEVLNLSDTMLDKVVKIQGTKFDRKRKLSNADIEEMRRLSKCGKSYSAIARMFGVSPTAVKYNVDDAWRSYYNATRDGSHYGFPSDVNERVSYKRRLVKAGAKVVYPMD